MCVCIAGFASRRLTGPASPVPAPINRAGPVVPGLATVTEASGSVVGFTDSPAAEPTRAGSGEAGGDAADGASVADSAGAQPVRDASTADAEGNASAGEGKASSRTMSTRSDGRRRSRDGSIDESKGAEAGVVPRTLQLRRRSSSRCSPHLPLRSYRPELCTPAGCTAAKAPANPHFHAADASDAGRRDEWLSSSRDIGHCASNSGGLQGQRGEYAAPFVMRRRQQQHSQTW